MDNQDKLQSFISITGNQCIENAFSKLEAVDWDLEQALQLNNPVVNTSNESPQPDSNMNNSFDSPTQWTDNLPPDIRTADTVVNEQLIDQNEIDLNTETSTSSEEHDTEYLCPSIKIPDYIHQDQHFEQAKRSALQEKKKYMLAIMLSPDTLQSIHITRDIWVHEIVQDTLQYNFYCWQKHNYDQGGQSFCNLYKINTFPFVGIIETETGKELSQIKMNGCYYDFVTSITDFIDEQEPKVIEKKVFTEPTENYYTFRFKFTDNTPTFIRKFSKTESVSILYDYIEQEYDKYNFNIFQSYPKKKLNKPDILSTLNLDERTNIIIEC